MTLNEMKPWFCQLDNMANRRSVATKVRDGQMLSALKLLKSIRSLAN